MIQAIGEGIFDVGYLISVITMGILMVRRSKGSRLFLTFGAMAIVLGCGDAFHLLPRVWALHSTGLESHAAALGLGKLVTSITMTVFYILLYDIWCQRYQVQGKRGITVTIWLLAVLRIALCFFPQNDWLSADAPISWGIYRNIPFALLGLVIIVLFFREAKAHRDGAFRWMWLAIALSFGFYIPVVLWADAVPLVGLLMIPKTCAYLWVVIMGYGAMQRELSALNLPKP